MLFRTESGSDANSLQKPWVQERKMGVKEKWLLPCLLGAVAGVLILGLGGRAAMAGLAMAIGASLNLSLRGVVEALVLSALLGTIAGYVWVASEKALQAAGVIRGILLGIFLFVCSLIATLPAIGRWQGAAATTAATLITAGVVCILFGIILDRLLTAYRRRQANSPGGNANIRL